MRSPPTPSATRPGPSALNASQILRTEEDRLVVLEKARRREALDSAMKRVVLGVLLLVALFIVVGGGRRVMNGHHHRDGDLLRHLRVDHRRTSHDEFWQRQADEASREDTLHSLYSKLRSMRRNKRRHGGKWNATYVTIISSHYRYHTSNVSHSLLALPPDETLLSMNASTR